MKTPALLVLALASLVSVRAQTSYPTTPSKATPETSAPPPKSVPANQAAPTTKAPAAKDAKKVEPPAKIEGVTIPRGKNFLGIQIVEGNFKLSFYDEKKKPMIADVASAVLRWDAKSKSGKERVVLSPSADRKSLTSPKTIRPPYTFKLFITLLKEPAENEDPVGENFVIDFQQ